MGEFVAMNSGARVTIPDNARVTRCANRDLEIVWSKLDGTSDQRVTIINGRHWAYYSADVVRYE